MHRSKAIMAAGLLISIALNVGQFHARQNVTAKSEGKGGAEASTTIKIDEITLEPTRDTKPPIRGEHWITSDFGVRESPFTGRPAIHYGTDYGGMKGAVIQAVKDGVVVTHWPPPDGYYKGHKVFGGFVEIMHDDGLSRYAHMSRTFVHEGQRVEAGDKIGIMGNTGMTAGKNGTHLHYSFISNNKE